MILDVQETYLVGSDTFFDSIDPSNSYGVTFEDNGQTGFFYAVTAEPELTILDALHVYDVDDVIDRDKPSQIQIFWREDFGVAFLVINNYCHAVFDFSNKAGYCRNGFPENQSLWANVKERELTDKLLADLEKPTKT